MQSRSVNNSHDEINQPSVGLKFTNEEEFYNWLSSQKEINKWNDDPKENLQKPSICHQIAAEKISYNYVDLLLSTWPKFSNIFYSGAPRILRRVSGKGSTEAPKKRNVFKPSQNFGSFTTTTVQKNRNDIKLYVLFDNCQSGRDISSFETWSRSKLSHASSS